MRFAFVLAPLALSALLALPAAATNRSFVYAQESRVLAPGESELEPWTTFRAGRTRYYSAVDGRLELEHGLAGDGEQPSPQQLVERFDPDRLPAVPWIWSS
jgi:hypothetical protein